MEHVHGGKVFLAQFFAIHDSHSTVPGFIRGEA